MNLYEGPKDCPVCGQRFRGGTVLMGRRQCDCASVGPSRSHTTALCRVCGWEVWSGCSHADGQRVDLFPSLRATD